MSLMPYARYLEKKTIQQSYNFYYCGIPQYSYSFCVQACASLEPSYQPPVTFVIVQKRHHTRLFANNHDDRNSTDKSGNILPGKVFWLLPSARLCACHYFKDIHVQESKAYVFNQDFKRLFRHKKRSSGSVHYPISLSSVVNRPIVERLV